MKRSVEHIRGERIEAVGGRRRASEEEVGRAELPKSAAVVVRLHMLGR
jgi:hypothetical protein